MPDNVLIISGASRGIGLATAELFLDRGWQVLNLSRSKPALAGIDHQACDMSDPDWLSTIAGTLVERAGAAARVAIVHNAGLLLKDSATSIDGADLQRVLQVNVVAPAQLNQLLLPHMSEGSSIVYVGSTLAEKAVANSCSYVTSKHAMLGLMRATCQDLIGTGIHTACVCPGFTETEMLSDHVGGSREVLDAIASGVAFKRLIEPVEIARTIGFAVDNPVINGAVLHANLGQIES